MWTWGRRQAFRLEWGPQAPEQGQEGLKVAEKELTLRDSGSPGARRSPEVRRHWARPCDKAAGAGSQRENTENAPGSA